MAAAVTISVYRSADGLNNDDGFLLGTQIDKASC